MRLRARHVATSIAWAERRGLARPCHRAPALGSSGCTATPPVTILLRHRLLSALAAASACGEPVRLGVEGSPRDVGAMADVNDADTARDSGIDTERDVDER